MTDTTSHTATERDTRERILDAAERQFAGHGIAGTSLRAITGEAQVNLAAVHYHFGSKDGLVRAVYERRLGPINAARLRLLEAAEAAAGDAPASLAALVEAFVAPPLRLRLDPDQGAGTSACNFMPLMGRIFSEPGEEMESILSHFAEVRRRFVPAFARALPQLSEADLLWRLHFTIGAMCQTAGAGKVLTHFSDGRCDATDVEGTIRRLVAFIAAGLQAPAPGEDA